MADVPLCPVVLSLLAAGPRRAHEVAAAVAAGEYPAARVTLERLRSAGLVRRRGAFFAITRRGQSELALQRMLWALSAGVGGAALR
jgi:hypothetical protein